MVPVKFRIFSFIISLFRPPPPFPSNSSPPNEGGVAFGGGVLGRGHWADPGVLRPLWSASPNLVSTWICYVADFQRACLHRAKLEAKKIGVNGPKHVT